MDEDDSATGGTDVSVRACGGDIDIDGGRPPKLDGDHSADNSGADELRPVLLGVVWVSACACACA